jgi:hypothetical protein
VTSSNLFIGLASSVTLEVGGCSAEHLMGASGVEIPMGVALSLDYPAPLMSSPDRGIASVDVPTLGSASIPPVLGFPSFLSHLQVCKFLLYPTLVNGCFLC